jgi:hypothetical protein
MLSYVVNVATDRIVEIDGPWDAFAARNGAPALTRAAVLSQSFLACVDGAEMKQLTTMLLSRVRSGEAVSLEFRCDSPGERRHLLFECFPVGDAAVHCATSLLRAEPRPVPAILGSSVARTEEILMVCSWCCRVRLDDAEWVEVEESIARLGLFEKPAVPRLSHGLCPACAPLLRARR